MARTAWQTLSYRSISWGCAGVLEALAHVNNPRRSLQAPVTAPLLHCRLPHTLPAAPCSLLGHGAETQDATSSLPAWIALGCCWQHDPHHTGKTRQGRSTQDWGMRRQGCRQTPAQRGEAAAGSATSRLVTAPVGLHTYRFAHPTDSTSHSIPQLARLQAHTPCSCLQAPMTQTSKIPLPSTHFGDSADECQRAKTRQASVLLATLQLT